MSSVKAGTSRDLSTPAAAWEHLVGAQTVQEWLASGGPVAVEAIAADYLVDLTGDFLPADGEERHRVAGLLAQFIEAGRWADVADRAERGFETVAVQEWEPDPERPGMSKLIRTKTVGEIHCELRSHLACGEYGLTEPGLGEYFSLQGSADREWPVRSRIAVFPERGGSEGDYVQVAALGGDGRWESLILGKGFEGRDAAWQVAKRLADLLGI